MGFIGVQLICFFFLSFSTEIVRDEIVIKKLVGVEDLKSEYCRVQTSPTLDEQCGWQSDVTAIDLIYLPQNLAEKIARHVVSAYEKNYYFDLNKRDFFHGHLLMRGPRTVYSSPEDYFSDARLVLYHSQEYISTWKGIEGFDPFVPHEQQRSFVGWFGEQQDVVPAIDLIDRSLYSEPYTLGTLRGYRNSGTIYMKDLNASVHESLHDHDGARLILNMQSRPNSETKCEIFQQIFILEESTGRFVSPDGKRFDITLQCKYRRGSPRLS